MPRQPRTSPHRTTSQQQELSYRTWSGDDVLGTAPAFDARVAYGYNPDADGSYFPDPEDYPPAFDRTTTMPSAAARVAGYLADDLPPDHGEHTEQDPQTPRTRSRAVPIALAAITALLLGVAGVAAGLFELTAAPGLTAPPAAPAGVSDLNTGDQSGSTELPAADEPTQDVPEPDLTDPAAEPTVEASETASVTDRGQPSPRQGERNDERDDDHDREAGDDD